MKFLLISLVIYFLPFLVTAQERTLAKGMKISKTTKIKKSIYAIDAPADSASSVITIQGNNIVIDFNNAFLKGSNKKSRPDQFFGTGILVKNSKNVTIKNLRASRYRVALKAIDVENLVIENCDFSYNYRQHLNSDQEMEDMSDWMSYHHNENDEWIRYGGAMYLRNCNFLTIRNCRVTGGQNALMMTACNDGMIYNNDFSFNSGIGIGMYRSSRNKIMFNKVIFNVRGYSHGVYNRGQDSAGMLVYEQSSNNLFFKNNVTHSGDGFFLWAGQTTMDSGKGGCNDNVILRNDFSYAPTNGVEATFSRNTIAYNRIFECDHGIWAGYSYETSINNNNFRNNRVGIAIEHGQMINITYNLFFRDKEAIALWERKDQPADPMAIGWGYLNNRDTKSRNYIILGNSFNSNPVVFNFRNTDKLNVFSNTYAETETDFKLDSTVTELDTLIDLEMAARFDEDSAVNIPEIARPNDPFKGTGYLAGRKNIMMTAWGPYDFRSPIIWNTNPLDTTGIMKFELMGPKGKWRIKKFSGVKDMSIMNGTFPASFTATKVNGAKTDISIQLEYIGETVVTPFGETVAAGKPYSFSFQKYFQPIKFNVRWFALDTAFHNPLITGEIFPPNVRMSPLKIDTVDKLDYAWWGGLKTEEKHGQFITIAEGEATIKNGDYELGVTWDDAVRVYVDGKLVINDWNPSHHSYDEASHKNARLSLGGKHKFLVEHIGLGNFDCLSLKLKKLADGK